MEGTARLIEVICKNFERLLRWVYPGVLFLTLWSFSSGEDIWSDWSNILSALVIGAVILIFQNSFISSIFVKTIYRGILYHWGWWINHSEDYANRFLRRMTINKLNSYIDYAWSFYHATSITGWLTLLFIAKWEHLSIRPVLLIGSFLIIFSSFYLWGLVDGIVRNITELPDTE